MKIMRLQTIGELDTRVGEADKRYGNFASTHEALGVCSEEWDELRAAVQLNDLRAVRHEALDLAAALIRLADQIESPELRARSIKVA